MTAIFDTHAHYDDDAFNEDREQLLAALPEQGIARVVDVGASLASCRKVLELMERYDYIYGAIGVHPSETAELTEESYSWLKEQCQNEKCLAVGEIGLDYYWPEPDHETQKKWFLRQLDLAREIKKPVIIHSRDAAKDTVDLMTEAHAEEIGGVIHCYSYTKETAKIFEQGRKYYDALKAVHDVVKGGVKVKKSIEMVADISEIYVRNYQKMLGDPNYTPDELSTISFGYAKLLSESADILQDLKNVVNVTGMSLSDAERLAIIDQSYKRLLEYRNLVQYYTDKNISVSYLRAKKKKDADRVVALYGDAEDRYW